MSEEVKSANLDRLDTGGEYRVVAWKDGIYVVGHGFVCKVSSEQEGRNMIRTLKGP